MTAFIVRSNILDILTAVLVSVDSTFRVLEFTSAICHVQGWPGKPAEQLLVISSGNFGVTFRVLEIPREEMANGSQRNMEVSLGHNVSAEIMAGIFVILELLVTCDLGHLVQFSTLSLPREKDINITEIAAYICGLCRKNSWGVRCLSYWPQGSDVHQRQGLGTSG